MPVAAAAAATSLSGRSRKMGLFLFLLLSSLTEEEEEKEAFFFSLLAPRRNPANAGTHWMISPYVRWAPFPLTSASHSLPSAPAAKISLRPSASPDLMCPDPTKVRNLSVRQSSEFSATPPESNKRIEQKLFRLFS